MRVRLIVLLSYNTPLVAPLAYFAFTSSLSFLISSLPPLLLPLPSLSTSPISLPFTPYVVASTSFLPLLEHAQRLNATLARPTSAELCLSHFPHSAVSLFLCLLPDPLLFPSEQHPPFTSNRLFDSSCQTVPRTNFWSLVHPSFP